MFGVSVFLYLGFPEAHLCEDIVGKFLNVNDSANYVECSEDIKRFNLTDTGISSGIFTIPNYLAMCRDVLMVIPNVLAMPVTTANYLLALGAPMPAVVIFVLFFLGGYVLAVLDWVRSGN